MSRQVERMQALIIATTAWLLFFGVALAAALWGRS